MPTKKKEVIAPQAETPLFTEIEVKDIPKQHKGNFNKNYETVLNAFKTATAKAIQVNCATFGEDLKSESVAHSFRMKINEQKLDMTVQLHADRNIVYLIKRK